MAASPRRASSRRALRWPRSKSGRRALLSLLAALLLGLLYLSSDSSEREHWTQAEILRAIRAVESGGRDVVPDGDNGLAIGPYQIHFVYWVDAKAQDPGIGGTYLDCHRADYAERVVAAYMRRYAAAAWQQGHAETIARTHNGGPRGPQNPKTLPYWRKVRGKLP